ncbi:hypothetical protein [Paenibacillus sp. GM2]|nr:hypothetical protein [Paenibacillus sp. GM2]
MSALPVQRTTRFITRENDRKEGEIAVFLLLTVKNVPKWSKVAAC